MYLLRSMARILMTESYFMISFLFLFSYLKFNLIVKLKMLTFVFGCAYDSDKENTNLQLYRLPKREKYPQKYKFL